MDIGLLWCDFPWEAPPPKVDKLLSSGVVGRNVARALRSLGTLVPYAASDEQMDEDSLVSFLRSIDVLWADLYPTSARAVRLRHEHYLACRIILYAGGTLPMVAEAMVFPWQPFLRPGDNLLVTCRADLEIWRRLVAYSWLREGVVPLPVDETVFRPESTTSRNATRVLHGLPLAAPLLLYVGRLTLVPYRTWTIQMDGEMAICLDPVWRHERRVSSIEWAALEKINGHQSLSQLADGLSVTLDVLRTALCALYLDGFILFERSTE